MLIGQAITGVKHRASKGVPNRDSKLSNRFIYEKLRTVREILLSQEVKKRQIVNNWSFQTLPCLEITTAALHECPCLPSNDCKILRSVLPLPQIFTGNDRHIIQNVGKIVNTGTNFMNIQFSETSYVRVKYQGGKKFTSKKSEFYIHNGYLYLTHEKTLEVISITALFNDPVAADILGGFCDDEIDCRSYLDFDMHIDGKLEDALIEMTAQTIMSTLYINEDRVTNASDETGTSQRYNRRHGREEQENYEQ